MSQISPDQERMATAIDEKLANILEDGLNTLDGEGKPVTIDPPAAYFNAAINRLKSLKVTRIVNPNVPEDPVNRIMNQLRFPGGGKIPPLDTDSPDAASA